MSYFIIFIVPCPEGTYFDTEKKTCELCPIGTYNNKIGQVGECTVCPNNKRDFQQTTETRAATDQNMCKGKLYGNKSKYKTLNKLFSINRCLLYPVFLSILTVKCKRGMYYDNLLGGSVDVEGLCVPCEFGQYQPNEGKFKCIPCGIGLTTRTRVIQSLFRIYIYIYKFI